MEAENTTRSLGELTNDIVRRLIEGRATTLALASESDVAVREDGERRSASPSCRPRGHERAEFEGARRRPAPYKSIGDGLRHFPAFGSAERRMRS